MDALDRARRVLGEKHPTRLILTLALGPIYSDLNQLEKAEALALRSLGTAPQHPRRGASHDHGLHLSSWRSIYVQQQQFDKAGPLTEQVLQSRAGACPLRTVRFCLDI